MKLLDEIIDRVNAGGISGEWATQSQVAASSAVDKLELPAIPDDAVVDLVGCLIDEVVRLRKALANAEGYGVETKARLRDANSEIERLQKDRSRSENELDRLREWVAAVEDGYDKQKAEIERLRAIINAKLPRRKCHDCGHVGWYADSRTPYCLCDRCCSWLCDRCRSWDTRRVKGG